MSECEHQIEELPITKVTGCLRCGAVFINEKEFVRKVSETQLPTSKAAAEEIEAKLWKYKRIIKHEISGVEFIQFERDTYEQIWEHFKKKFGIGSEKDGEVANPTERKQTIRRRIRPSEKQDVEKVI